MLDRKVAPPFQKTLSIVLPKPIAIGLASGVRLFLIPDIRQNVAKIDVTFSAGKWYESKTGLSHFTSLLLEKGTATKSAREIANTLDYYGASLEIQSGFDFVSIALYTLKSQWQNVFPLFLEIIREPVFPEEEWTLAKQIFLQNLKINQEKTSYLASARIRKNIFGPHHPYGSSIEEPEVQALALDDFSQFFNSSFGIHSIYGIGQFEDAEIEQMQQGFQSLPKAISVPPAIATAANAPFMERVEKAGSVQSSIRLGKRSLLKTDPDYFDLLIFNHLLGGFFGSRLMKNIREEKGLTYGIHSSVNSFHNGGLLMIGADVNKVNLDLAVREIKSELRKLRVEPVGEEELMLARNHFIGSLQADMASLFSVIEKIKSIHLNDLPADYYQALLQRIDQVSPGDIQRTAEKYFHEDSFFEVAVG